TGNLNVKKIITFNGFSEEMIKKTATKIVDATQETNATALAIKKLNSDSLNVEIKKVIPFSSETKYSGFIDINNTKYIMGAPEFIIKNPSDDLKDTIQTAAQQGFRIIAVLKQ